MTPICIGSEVNVFPEITGGQGSGYEFFWVGNQISDLSQGVTVAPTENTSYQVEVNDACDIVYSASMTVIVAPAPTLTASLVNGPICGPGSAFVHSGSTEIGPSGFCYWYAQGDTVYSCEGAQFIVSGSGSIDVGFYAEPVPGCISDTLFDGLIQILDLPHADFTFKPDEPTSVENLIQFVDLSSNAESYEWYLEEELFSQSSSPSLLLPTADIPENWPICLVTTHENSCTDTLCTVIPTSNELLLFIPTAFTPDNDGVNDFFKPVLRSVDIDRYSLSIFDRWGNIIWQTTDIEDSWNGAGAEESAYFASDGIYSWKIHVRRKDSTDEREYLGMVTLIR